MKSDIPVKLTCSRSDPPIAALLVIEKAKATANITWDKVNCLEADENIKFVTSSAISRYLSRILLPSLHGQNIIENCETDNYISLAETTLKDATKLDKLLAPLDQNLNNVVYLVGNGRKPTLSDYVIFEYLHNNLQWQKLKDSQECPVNVARWYKHLLSQDCTIAVLEKVKRKESGLIKPAVTKSVLPKNKSNKGQIPKEEGKFVELPGAKKGEVVVRFPPEASGYLHIGHAKAALLNQHYQISFDGKLIMRFDDTNPAKEKEDFEKVILEDVSLLQIKPDMFTYTSDHFELILNKCIELMELGLAYVDDTDPETMKAEREQRTVSKNRNNPLEKNLLMWDEMVKGSEYGQKCCVRAKIDMSSDNGCMRDPTLYRCKKEAHPRTGNKYNVYPTYDFACPIVDSTEGVTHALRTTEYHDRDDQYFWVLDALKMRRPYIYEYSRLNMTNTVLSKRKLTWFVEQKLVDGWDDPRMPTVRGVLRKGMTVEGLKQFIIAQGSSRSVVMMEWDKIWAFNKKVIDPIVPRYSAVEKDSYVPVYVTDAKEEAVEVPKHPKNNEIGTKAIWMGPKVLVDSADAKAMQEGDMVTFINWGNLLIKKVELGPNKEVQSITAELRLDNKDYKKTLKVTWLADTPAAPLVPCAFIYYNHLISKAVLGKDEDFKNCINKQTMVEVVMLGDPELKNLKKSDIVQIQRKGYFICDQPYDDSTSRYIGREAPLVMIYVPDGSKDLAALPLKAREMLRTEQSVKEETQKGKPAEKIPKNSIAPAGDADQLNQQIVEQNNKVQDLKAQKTSKEAYTSEVAKLLELKAEYKQATGADWKPGVHVDKKDVVPEKSTSGDDLNAKVVEQGNKVRDLKAQKASKEVITSEVAILKDLKAQYKEATGVEWKPGVHVDKKEIVPQEISASGDDLNAKVVEQGNKVRDLKAQKASKEVITSEVVILKDLKAQYKEATGVEWKPGVHVQKEIISQEISASGKDLNAKIVAQVIKVRDLTAQKVGQESIDPEIEVLLDLKAQYQKLTGIDWKASVESSKEKGDSAAASKPKSEVTSGQKSIDEQIRLQGDKIRKLESEKVDNATIDREIEQLLKLKAATGKEKGASTKEPQQKKPKKSEAKVAEEKPGIKKVTRLGMEAKKEENLSDWYSQVITKSEMIEYYDISGCYILRPWAYKIWSIIQNYFNEKIEGIGVENCYFPMFVSASCLEKEKTHISDFSPEVAWVTKSGSSDLMEPIAIRPTSETVMYPYYAKWIRSHRDLPLQLNQWCNVVRWEFKHPQPFLRTREFLWQEGHTAFATKEEAVKEVSTILGFYADIYEKLLAIPVIRGKKTEKEKFAGGDYTTTVEAFISASGRAIQGGTSHHLGQNFSKMFEVVFDDPETNEKKYVYQNSWGLTTRTIGVLVMVHADNSGLVLPPMVACYQIVIVPCGITASTSEQDRKNLIEKCKEFQDSLSKVGLRVHGDYRDNYSPGWKYNYWELKGVPVRVELGPRDLAKGQFVAVRRDTAEKITMSQEGAAAQMHQLLDTIQANLYNKAKQDLDSHLKLSLSWDDFCRKLDEKCIIQAPFCGDTECEDLIKADSACNADVEPGAPSMGAKGLCIPFTQPQPISDSMACIHPKCKAKPKYFTVFGRSY